MIQTDPPLLARVTRTIREQHLFFPDDTLIVAISGGADSTALLDLLGRLPGHHLTLVAAHLNHCLRGDESDGDEEFCRQLAMRYAIPFESRRIDVRELAAAERRSTEDAGRHARIRFLDEIGLKYGAAAIVLAHHADDQAETLLMRLLRGSGMTGLSSMAFRNRRGYVRPLLQSARSDILEYLRQRGLEWREDESNRTMDYLRNRIRHELLPLLEGYNPAIRKRLADTAAILGEDESLLDKLADEAFQRTCRADNDGVACDVTLLNALDLSLRRRVLRHAVTRLAGSPAAGTGKLHIDTLCGLLASGRPNLRISLPGKILAVREYGRLHLGHTPESALAPPYELTVDAPGEYPLPGGGKLTVALTPPPDGFESLPAHCAFFDPVKAPFPWHVRTFRNGDRIRPFGMSGSKKVKDIFIDRKIPLSDRRRIPLVFCGDELVWIAGVCRSVSGTVGTASGTVAQAIFTHF